MRSLVSLLIPGMWLVPAAALAAGAAPIAKPVNASSLYRPDATWKVETTIVLAADDEDGSEWTFSLVQPSQLQDPGDAFRLNCNVDGSGTLTSLKDPIKVSRKTLMCRYQPPLDFAGDEVFQYQVRDGDQLSQPAAVTVSVEHGGLRWEFVANNETAITSDSSTPGAALPDIAGSTAQDFLARLDWVVRNPRFPKDEGRGTRVGVDVTHTANAHFRFELGFVTEAQAVTATTQGTVSTPGSAAPVLVSQRKFTTGGEFNYNAVFAPDAGGTFLEVGVLGRGNLDAAVEPATQGQTIGGQLVTLVRNGTGAGTFRAEGGVRLALKQYSDDPLRTAVSRTTTDEAPTVRKNSDNLLEFEFSYRRDTALAGLSQIGISENRYVVRVLGSPEIPGIPGHLTANVGIELTGWFESESPKEVKILYGMNASTFRLFR